MTLLPSSPPSPEQVLAEAGRALAEEVLTAARIDLARRRLAQPGLSPQERHAALDELNLWLRHRHDAARFAQEARDQLVALVDPHQENPRYV